MSSSMTRPAGACGFDTGFPQCAYRLSRRSRIGLNGGRVGRDRLSTSSPARTSPPQSGHRAGSGSRASMANGVLQPRHMPATVSRRSGQTAGRCAPSSRRPLTPPPPGVRRLPSWPTAPALPGRAARRSGAGGGRTRIAHHLSRAIRRQPHQTARPAHLRFAVPRRTFPVDSPPGAVPAKRTQRDRQLLFGHPPDRRAEPACARRLLPHHTRRPARGSATPSASCSASTSSASRSRSPPAPKPSGRRTRDLPFLRYCAVADLVADALRA